MTLRYRGLCRYTGTGLYGMLHSHRKTHKTDIFWCLLQ